MAITSIAPTWLLLVFSLPVRRASQRVEVWRRLQRFGAIPLGNSGYLLPNQPDTRERFEWLATSIRDYGGEASVLDVQNIDNLSSGQLILRFQDARKRDYEAWMEQARQAAGYRRAPGNSARLVRLRTRLEEITAIDFFASPLRKRAEAMVEAALRSPTASSPPLQSGPAPRPQYRRRTWVTRPRPGVDRVSSAWLIRRFIDPAAKFAFAMEGRAARKAIPFDMYSGGFGHRGDDCTFETLRKVFRVADARVTRLGEMVHDADLMDGKFGRSEGFGLDSILRGWAKQGWPDHRILERGMDLVEGIYRSMSREAKPAGGPGRKRGGKR